MIEFLAAALLVISFAEINEVKNIAKQLDTVSSHVRTVSTKVDTVQHEVAEVSTKVDMVQHGVTKVSTKVDTVQREVAEISRKVDTVQHEIAVVSGKVDTAIDEIIKLGVNTAPTKITIVLPHIEKVLSAIKEMLSDINIKTTHTFIYKSDTSLKTTDTSPKTTVTSSEIPDPSENYGYAGICKLIKLGCKTTPDSSAEGANSTAPDIPPLYFDNRLAQEINAGYQKVSANIRRLEHWVINNRKQLRSEIKRCEKNGENPLACYSSFIIKKVGTKTLKEDIGASMDFFEELSKCHYSADCDREKTHKYLLEKAKSTYANFFPYVCRYRNSLHSDVWENVEQLFVEILKKPKIFTCACKHV